PSAELRARAIEAGATSFMTKPPSPRELVAHLRAAIANQARLAMIGAERDGLREAETRVASLLAAVSPPGRVTRGRARIESRVVPCTALGGDLFDLVDVGPGTFAALLVDVAGKGAPAAVTAAAIRWLARDRLLETRALAPTLAAINAQLSG